MRKVKSFIKKSNIKSFILGIAIAILISFGVTVVLAVSNDQGGGNSSDENQFTETYGFIGQNGGLVNKIGSLTIGKNTDDKWIMDPANECLTQGDGTELQTCLSVVGSASFSKLTVLDMPAFIQNSSLFLNESGDQSFLASLPKGLVIDDFAGNDDSIMVSSLQYEVDGSLAPRNLDEQRQLCADQITGKLVVCGQTTYHWDIGTWSDCSIGSTSGGTCSGTWTSTGIASCIGTYQDKYCDGGVIELYDSDPMVEDCRASIYNCEDASYQNQISCENVDTGRCNNNCVWHSNTINCSTLGATTSSQCISSPHNTCNWDSGSNIINNCSDKNGTSSSECTGYNSACSWSEGTGNTKTRTVVCKDSSNNTVADSFCTDTKPVIEESCDINYTCTGTINAGCRSDTQDGLLEGGDIRSGTCSGTYMEFVRATYSDQNDWCKPDENICSEHFVEGGDINDCKIQTDQFCDDGPPDNGTCHWEGDILDCTAQYSEQSCSDLVNYSELNGTIYERPCTWDQTLTTDCSVINPQSESECTSQNQQGGGGSCAWVSS